MKHFATTVLLVFSIIFFAGCNLNSENKDWVKYFPSLSNTHVLELIKQAHVALLPTWMDTYGYSVLECQSGGCPVVTTNLRALTEINNDELGWVIPVPTNRLKHPVYSTLEDFDNFKTIVESGLETVLEDIFKNKYKIKEKGIKCIENISLKHNPFHYANSLNKIYNSEFNIKGLKVYNPCNHIDEPFKIAANE